MKDKALGVISLVVIFILFQNFGTRKYRSSSRLEGSVVQVAPGGGGRMPGIAISPHDRNRILVATDMGTLFHSKDRGLSFQQISSLQFGFINMRYPDRSIKNTQRHHIHPIVWHTHIKKRVFLTGAKGLFYSDNNGQNWSLIGNPNWLSGPYIMNFSLHKKGRKGIAIFDTYANKKSVQEIYYTHNQGLDWAVNGRVTSLIKNQMVTGHIFDHAAGLHQEILATQDKVLYKKNWADSSWKALMAGLPANAPIKLLSGYSKPNGDRSVYLITKAFKHSGVTRERMYRLKGNPLSNSFLWEDITDELGLSKTAILGRVEVNASNTRTAYVSYDDGKKYGQPPQGPLASSKHGGVLKTENAGNRWEEVFFSHRNQYSFNTDRSWLNEELWIWAQKPDNVVSDPNDEDFVLLSSSGLYRSVNGGKDWLNAAAKPINRWGNTVRGGIPVMSVWDYYDFKNHHIMASTDFPLWSSHNAGYGWRKSNGHAVLQNIYSVAKAYDSSVSAINDTVLFGVGGSRHDIPTWNFSKGLSSKDTGSIVVSKDYFKTYETVPLGNLPKGVIRDIHIDQIDGDSYDIYVAVFGQGVYVSENKGFSWYPLNYGLSKYNKNILDIGRTQKGELYALVTIRNRGNSYSRGNLYFWQNKDGHMQWVSKIGGKSNTLLYPTSVEFVPGHKNLIYATSWTSPTDKTKPNKKGGLWKSMDYGRSWSKVAKIQAGASSVTVDPQNTNKIHVSVFDTNISPELVSDHDNFGLFTTRDGGSTWSKEDLPIVAPMKLRIYGRHRYLTTFGNGVLKLKN